MNSCQKKGKRKVQIGRKKNSFFIPAFFDLFKVAPIFFAALLFFFLDLFVYDAQAAQIKKVYRGVANFDAGDSLVAVPIGGTVDPVKTVVLISAHSDPSTANAQGERNYFFAAQLAGNDTLQIERGGSDRNAIVNWQVVEFASGVRVQSGISSVDVGQLTKSINLPPLSPPINIANAVPIISFRTSTGGNANTSYARTNEFFLKPTLSSGPTLTLERLKAQGSSRDKPIALVWQLVEFQTDAKVYSGEVCLRVPASATGPQSVTNNGLDPDGSTTNCGTNASAFSPALSNSGQNALLFYYPMYGSGFAGEDARIFVRGAITDDTTVTFTRGYAATTASTHVRIQYYVVDFADGSGTSGNLGHGAKGSLASSGDPGVVNISSSTDATCPTTVRVTTASSHGFAVNDFVTVGAHGTNTAANGTWIVSAVPTSTTFDITDYKGVCVEGSGAGAGGNSGSTGKYRETNLSTPYGTVDSTRLVTLVTASATSASTGATNSWADDLLYANYLYQRSATWYLQTARCSTCRSIAADYEYITYEFPSISLLSPNGSEVLVVGDATTITWSAAASVASNDWKLQIWDGTAWQDMTGSTYGTCDDSTPTNYSLDCNKTATGMLLSDGSVHWKVPDRIRNDLKIRLWDQTDTTTDSGCKRRCDSSNTAFTIRGSITNVQVVDSEGVVNNTTNPASVFDQDTDITWNHTGSIGNVKIDMDTDNDGLYGEDDNPDDVVVVSSTSGTAGSYTNWQVPNIPSTTLKIRVKAISDTTGQVQGFTSNFEIRPAITIIKPDASSVWLRGQGQSPNADNGKFVWCEQGNVGAVDIWLSSNAGSTYGSSPILDGVFGTSAGTGTANCPGNKEEFYYNWSVASSTTLSATYKVKIVKDGDVAENVKDIAPRPDDGDGLFEIKATVQIDGPPTTDILKVQQSPPVQIAWSSPGGSGLGLVRIKYCTTYNASCKDNPAASGWTQISGATNLSLTDSPFGWSVPNTPGIIGTDLGILVEDQQSALIWDQRGPYTVKGRFNVTSPVSGDTLRVGGSKLIQWTPYIAGQDYDVYICLEKNGSGVCDYDIVNASGVLASSNQYNWTNIPDQRCDPCKVTVYKPGDLSGTFGKSADFKIKGNISNVAVSGTSPYPTGQNVTITWTSNPASPWTTVRLRYSTNGADWTDFSPATQDSHPGSRSWTIPSNDPGIISSTVRIRVQDDTDAANTYSDSPQFQVKPSLTLTYPVGGETFVIGTQETITWTSSGGNWGNIKIKYSVDNGNSYPYTIKTIAVGNGGSSYSWCVGKNDGCVGITEGDNAHDPALVIGSVDKNTQVKIKLEGDSDPSIASPAMGTALTIKKRYKNVDVVPASRILYVDDTTNPLAGIVWATDGSTASNVYLAYQTSGYTFPTNNIVDTPGASDVAGYALWTVPDAISTTARIRVKSSAFPNEIYADSTDFTIKGKIDISAPTGTSTLVVGNDYTIQYVKHGSIGNLKIEYNRTGCATPLEISPGGGATGATSFVWNVSATDGCSTSVIDTSGTKKSSFTLTGLTHILDSALKATATSQNFQIRGELYDLKPDNAGGFDGAVFTYGTGTRYIMWKNRGQIGNVKIRLDKYSGNGANGTPNDGDEFQQQMTGPNGTYPNAEAVPYNFDGDGAGSTCDPAGGGYSCWEWNVPDDFATTYRIRIESVDNPASLTNGMATYVTHTANFRIRGSITVSALSGLPWKTAETGKLIDWTAGGTVGDVSITLLYDLDSDGPPYGSPYAQSLSITSDNNGTKPFPWNIPNNLSTEAAVVRVTALGDSTVTDDSDEFKIKPVLNVTYPNQLSDELKVGSLQNLTWAAPMGTVSTIKVNVSTNGTTWNDGTPSYANFGGLVVASTAADQPYNNWSVPDIMSNTAKIRICKILNGSPDLEACDLSGAFNIIGEIKNVYINNTQVYTGPNDPIDLPIDNDKWIVWEYNGSMANVDIYYTTNALAGSPTWTLIPDADGAGSNYISGDNVPLDDGSAGNFGSFKWKIPNAPSPDVRVKVLNNHNDAWKDIETLSCSTGADCTNSIIGSVTEVGVVADGNPATTNMEVTGSKTIQWKPNGNITTFKVEYRKDGGSWFEITPGGGCSGTCFSVNGDFRQWTWTNIPDQISTDIDFRVSDYNDPTKVNCISSDAGCNTSPVAGYILKGKLSVVSPIVTDIWTLGATASPSIRWNKQGTIGDLKIEYSTTGTFGASDYSNGYVFTIESAYASGSNGNNDYAWPAGVIGASRKISDVGVIRACNTTDCNNITGTQLVAVSPAFKIRPSFTSFSSPSAGSIWFVGDTNRTITWSCNSGTKFDGSLPKVTLQYRVDGGSFQSVTGAGNLDCVNGTNNYTWPNVADEKSNNAEIRVSFNDYATYNPLISSSFKIHPKITVTPTPDANTKLKVGSTYNNLVKWTYTGTKTTTVDIKYDTNGGAGGYPGTVATNQSVGNGSTGVTWSNVPNIIGTNIKVKVVDSSFADAFGESPAFKVMAGISNIQPSGGTNKTANTTMNITWDYTGTVGTFKVYYDLASGTGGYTLIDSPASATYCASQSCSYSWVYNGTVPVPDNVLNTARIKVTNASDETDVVLEGTDFKFGAGVSNLLPANGQVINAGSTNTYVTWNKDKGLANATRMRIEYTNNASGTPTWTTITPGPVPGPEGTENTGSFLWSPIPSTLADLSADLRLRMTQINPDNSAVTLQGAGTPFAIKAQITVTEPTGSGSESWGLLEDHDIKFTKKGALQTVNIYYSPDGTFDGTPTSEDTPINGTPIDISALADDTVYTWSWQDIPANTTLTSGYSGKIKVRANTPAAQLTLQAQGISAGGFQVRGSIANALPSGATDLEVTGSKEIRWTPTGNITTFKVEYSHVMSGGPTWIEITPAGGVAGTPSGADKTWTWTNIPDTISNNVLFKISDYNNPNAFAVSASPNIIKGKLSIVSPTVTDVWTLGVTPTPSIRWNKQGSIGDLKIEYSTNGFANELENFTIESAYASGADGNVDYAWAAGVIGANRKISDSGKIRISNVNPPAGTGLTVVSPAFKIRPSFTSVSSPASGVIWYVGDTNRTITWVCNSGTKGDGSLPKVTLQYRVNGGSFQTVTGAGNLDCTNGTNNYSWPAVADERTNNAEIQVSFNDYATHGPMLSASFKIHPKIIVTPTPAANTKLVVGSNNANLIKWTYTGTTTTAMEIRYDTGAGTFPANQTIATDVAPNLGSTGVSWNNIPDIIGTNVKVRVFDKDFTDALGDSPAFKVMGGITNLAPTAGTNKTADTTMNVTWNYTGTIGSFNVYYDAASGTGGWNQIGTSLASSTYCTGGACTFPWLDTDTYNTDAVLNTARLKVTNASDETDVFLEGTDFKRGASVNNLLPANGQVINVGSTNTYVTWDKLKGLANTTKMKIEYTNDASAGTPTWTTITPGPGTDNTGSFLWNPIPGTLADLNADLRLRITQQTPDNSVVTLQGAGTPFVIKAVINVTEPTGSGSESWGLLEDHDIKFTKKGALQTVNIYYAPDGVNYETLPINASPIDVSALADDTVYTWLWEDIPVNTTLSTGYSAKIKVRANTPAAQLTLQAQGISAGGFQVRGSIANALPEGVTMEVGGTREIRWTPTGAITAFKVEYSHVDSATPTWIEITPSGGVAGTPSGADKTWTWTNIPDTISNRVRFRVSDYNNPNAFDETADSSSPGSPRNVIKGKLSIVSPIITDIWTVGTTPAAPNNIRWNKTGSIGDLLIEYSTNGFADELENFTIANNYASGPDGNNDISPLWQAGIILSNRKISETGKIRIKNIGAPVGTELTALSPAFKIRPAFSSITKPTGSTVWYADDTDAGQTIDWVTTSGTKGDGSVPNCIVEYSLDGVDYTTIAGSTSCAHGSRSILWSQIPSTLRSSTVRVRVSYLDYTSINIESPQFTIRPKIVVTPTPDANTKLVVGSNNANLIKWTYSGTTTGRFVEIRYSTDGSTFPSNQTIATDVAAGSGATGVSWNNVPDIIGTNVKVRVFDKDFPSALGDSPAFKVMGGLTLTGPTSGTTKTASMDTDVTWNFTGSIANVNVYYDADSTNGLTWTLVGTKNQSGCTGSCSYTWTTSNSPAFPAVVGNNYRIKITNAADETDVYSEGTDFKIGAQFDITFPENGSPVYAEDVSTDITWSTLKGSSINKINLYYSNSDLSSSAADPTSLGWIRITPSGGVANSSPYNWNPIPRGLTELSTTQHRLLITQADPANEANVYNISGGTVFPILGKLIMTNPSAGTESWGVNTTQTLKFKKQGNLQSAELYYSYDGQVGNYVKIKRADNSTLVDISDATGVTDGQGNYSFDWFLDPTTTALTNGFTGKIKAKVVDPSTQTSVESVPSPNIEVKGTVTLCAPGGSLCATGNDPTPGPMSVGNTYVIKWEKFGAVNNVEIHYSTNGGIAGGGSYPAGNLIFDGASTPSQFTWDIPNVIDNDLKIRVRHKENTGVWDESDVNFRIKGSLTLAEPENSGLSYTVGTSQTISWSTTGSFSPVELHYDRDGNFGTTGDTFPVLPLSTVNNCTPGGTPPYQCNGSASFTIEDKIGAANKVRIRGTGINSDVQWISTNPFKIVGALDVTTPESGQVWLVGETNRQIAWDATGTITNVNIGYKTSAGGACNYTNIVSNHGGHVAGGNTYDWTAGVADERTETAYICIQDANFPEVVNVSAAPFSIRPKITVTGPVGTDRIAVGSNNANLIKWTYTGTKTALVDVFYSVNNGADNYPNQIADDVDITLGPAGINWNNVPDTMTNQARIKVVDANASFPNVYGLSSTFKIVGGITLTTPPMTPPATKVILKKGQTNYLIQWTKTGSLLQNVSIWYSTNGGSTFTEQIVSSTNAALGQYSWPTVANTPSANVIIRVADYDDPETKALSTPIAIQSNLNLSTPDGGEVWAVGSSQDITWTTDGTTNNVKLQYSTNGGGTSGTWNDIAGATNLTNTGTFSWTVPDSISDTVKVRVIDVADPPVDTYNPGNWNETGQTSAGGGAGTGNPFKIRADLTILSPNGNSDPALTDKLTVGSVVPIQWRVVGTVGTVKLQLSVDGGAYADISGATNLDSSGYAGTPLTKSYNWTVPNNISSQVKVRVVNEGDATVFDSSDFNFHIQGQLTFNPALPQGGDATWFVGDTKTLTWVKTGTISAVKLQYSKTSNSAGFIDVPGMDNLSGTTVNWTISNDFAGTNPIDPSVWIRLINQDSSKPTVAAVSGQIELKGKLTLNAPISTDSWQVDSNYQILWIPSGNMGTVKIEYSVDDFTTPLPVLGPSGESAANLPAGTHNVQQSFTWKIPNNISNNAKIRITPNTASDANAVTSAAFKIAGGFLVLTPNGGPGVFYEVDGTTAITWEKHGTIAQAKLQYSTNAFINENEVFDITTVNASDLSYNWTIPDAIGTNVKVRIIDPAPNNFTQADVSNNPFEIRGKLEFASANNDSPLGGEIWLIDETRQLKFTKRGTIPTVKIEYKVGAGAYAYVKDPAGTEATSVGGNTFNWKIPDQKGLNNVVIKVTNLANPTNVYVESAPFTIRGGHTWTNPSTSGQVMFVSTTEVLSWTSFGTIPNVDLKYSTGGINGTYNFMQLQAGGDADNIANCTPTPPALNCNATFNWNIPNQISKVVYVKIEDSTDPDAVNIFGPIKIAGKIYIDEPDNTPEVERWGAGTFQDIRWTMDGTIANLKIEYSINDGASWVTPAITDSIVGTTLVKNWQIPSTTTPNARIRISDVITDSGTPAAISNAFKIVGSFSFTAPTSSSVFPVTSGEISNPTQNIIWGTQGVVPNINLRYRPNPAAAWTLINGTPIADGGAGGSYAWTVPDIIGTQVEVKIEDAADADTYLISPQFTVRGDLNLTAPVGGEKWGVGSQKAITWQKNGSISLVAISYSKTGAGGPWIPIQDPIDLNYTFSNTGSFVWTVPDEMTTQARIRVENADVSSSDTRYVKTDSPANFKILARFDILNPDGGEIALAGQNYNVPNGITWNKWGSLATNVRIELATNGNNPTPTYDKVITPNTPNDGSFNPWLVDVNWITPNAKIRIYDVNDIDSADASANPFAIRASFTFLEPTTGTPELEVGEQFHIIWQRQGNIPNVKLEYSPNNNNFTTDIRPIEPTPDGIVPNQDTVSGDPTQGRYIWTVPDIEDNKDENIRLRIRDPNDIGAETISQTFKIVPKFTLTFPNGNADPNLTDKLKVATPYDITWTSSSTQTKTPNVNLYYSTNGGGSWNIITTTANDGTYSWVTANGGVPDIVGTETKIRVEDATESALCTSSLGMRGCDSSNNNFKVISDFVLTAPDGGATYEVSDPFTVTWDYKGTISGNVELAYSTNGSDFSNPVIFAASTTPNNVSSSGNPNRGSYSWIIPNAIGYNVRVRVRSLGDDGFDISNNNFRIRGKLAVTAPALGTPVPIGQNYNVTWTQTGTIPSVDIYYSTTGSGGPFTQIADDAPSCTPSGTPPYTCTGSYTWTNVPDTATANAVIKIVDARTNPDNSDVIGFSSIFNIVGNFTLLEPNGGEDWRVGTQHDIRFNWGGTMPNVEFHYTKTNANPSQDTGWILIGSQNYGAGNGSGGAVRTYSWTIPNDIAPAVKVRVRFVSDPSVYDVSNNSFAIRAVFTLTSPNGNSNVNLTDRWVTFEQRTIQWVSVGTVPNVTLQYSNDNFVSDIRSIPAGGGTVPNCTPTPPSDTCNGSYLWTVDDRVLKNGTNFAPATDLNAVYSGPNMIKIRVIDANDAGVFDDSDHNVKLDYYKMTWDVRDLLTNAPLSGLTAKAYRDTDQDFIIWNQAGLTTNPPIIKYFPYGTWVVDFRKTEYTDMSVTVTADQDRDYSQAPLGPLFMQTSTVHIWASIAQVAYDPGTDVLTVVGWLERDGSRVPGAIEGFFRILDQGTIVATLGSPTAANPKNAIIGAGWEGSSIPPNPPHEPALPDAEGFFKWTLNAPTGLQSGKVYVGDARIKIGTGGVFKTPMTFDVTDAIKLEEVKNTVNAQLDKPLSQVETAIIGQITALIGLSQGETVKQILQAQTSLIETAISDFETTVQTSVAALQSGAEESLAAAATLKSTAERFSWKASASPNPALTGETITIQAQGLPGLQPVLSIYNHENKEVIASGLMKEDLENPGNYSFSFVADPGVFSPGKIYTYLVSEDTTGGLAAGSGFVESMSLTTIAGLAAAAPGAERAAKEAVDAVKALEAVISKGGDVGGVKDAVADLRKTINEIPTLIKEAMSDEDSPVAQIKVTIDEVQKRLKELAGQEGYDFSQIFQKALSESPDVKQIRQATDNIDTSVQIMNAIVEAKLGGVDEPIVQVSYTSGSVVLRVVAVNPSDVKVQEVPIKIYLPQEAGPANIIEMGELQLSYDFDKGLYFVYKEKVVLQPKETRVFTVELDDIWFIKQELMDSLRTQTEHIVDRLKDTPYQEQANIVAQTIYGRLAQISASQADESINKELHIGLYRTNLKTIDRIKEDIAKLEKLLVAVGAPPAPDILAESKLNLKTPSRATTWFIIFAILIFIGLLGAVFFFTWQAQIRVASDLSFKNQPESFPGVKPLNKEEQKKAS